jgi:large conductance mechanosensitive channel
MIDMAIGIIIGASFKTVVNVLVKRIIMPPLDYLTNDIKLKDKVYILKKADGDIKEISIGYGELIESFATFLVIGFILFIVVKFMNKLKKKAEDIDNTEVETPKDIELLSKNVELNSKIVELLEELNNK